MVRENSRWLRFIFAVLLVAGLAACSMLDVGQDESSEGEAQGQEAAVIPEVKEAVPTETAVVTLTAAPSATSTATATATPTAAATPTATATPVVKPADFEVVLLPTFGREEENAVVIQDPIIGEIFVVDELVLDTPFEISWTDDNPRTAVIRFRNWEGITVELNASIDPGHGEIPIEQLAETGQAVPRHVITLKSADIFRTHSDIERMATIVLTDEDDHSESFEILFSRHDYADGFTDPLELAQPQYDQLELGIDWRSEQYAPQGAFAEWLNSQPEMWNWVTIDIEGRAPISWQGMREDSTLLHRELAAAAYGDPIEYFYFTADGQSQRFALDTVPFYTQFEIVHSPEDEREFFTLRAGRGPGVTKEALHEMGEIVRHMFSNRPGYLHQLAENRAVHSVAPGEDLRVLPEIGNLAEIEEIIEDDEFGQLAGIALGDLGEEISASAIYFFDIEEPLGVTLMHEVVHQVQHRIYGPSWSDLVVRYYENYMALPDNERIPDIDYYETSPWEWDAFLTPLWFAQGSLLSEDIEPYLDLVVSDQGTTIRDYLQRRWGDPLDAYVGH